MTARVLPTIPTFVPGPLSSASLNTLANAVAFVLNIPSFRMYQSVAQNLPNATWTQLALDTQDYDSDGGRSGISPYTYTIPSNLAGRWTFNYGGSAASNTTGVRDHALYKNGAPVPASQANTSFPVAAAASMSPRPQTIYCAAGDQIALYMYQNSGGTLATDVTANNVPYLEGRLVSLGNP